MPKKKQPKGKAESHYGLTIHKRQNGNGKLLVELYAPPIPREQYTHDYHIKSAAIRNAELHPFALLPLESGKLDQKQVTSGYYVDHFEDSPVVNAIVDTLADRKLLIKSSGKSDWRVYRARLVHALDLLWG